MKSKIQKFILITTGLLILPFAAKADNLIEAFVWDSGWVGFNENIIFKEEDFKPGDSKEREIRVDNLSDEEVCVGIRAQATDCENGDPIDMNDIPTNTLANDLGVEVNGWSGTLFDMFSAGEIDLFCLEGGGDGTFEMGVSYPDEKTNQEVEEICFSLEVGVIGSTPASMGDGVWGGGMSSLSFEEEVGPRVEGEVTEKPDFSDIEGAIKNIKKGVEDIKGAVMELPQVSLYAGPLTFSAFLGLLFHNPFLRTFLLTLAVSGCLLAVRKVFLIKKTS